MGGDLSDDDSIHLNTPPKGAGRCCAGRLCCHTHSRYFPSGLCSDCYGYSHDKDCAQVGYDGIWAPGKWLVCMLCVHKHWTKDEKAKEKERHKNRQETRKFEKQKKCDAQQIHNNTNPFNYNQMQKVLKERNLEGYLSVKNKSKYRYKRY